MRSPRFLIAGQLRREYVILPCHPAILDAPGGNLLYAGVGVAVWAPDPPPAVVARVGEEYPPEWLEDFARHGFDVRGIRVLAQPVDLRSFTAYTSRSSSANDDPVSRSPAAGNAFPPRAAGLPQPCHPANR